MSKKYITKDLEIFDVVSAFPNLKESLLSQKINPEEIIEGKSIEKFLIEKHYSPEQIELFIKRINTDLNLFLYKENLKTIPILEEENYTDNIILENLEEPENLLEEEE